MAERKTYTAEDFKGCNGRRALVEGMIDDPRPDESEYVEISFPGAPKSIAVHRSAIVEILPEEIKVGDRVQHKNGAVADVRCVDGDALLVRYTGGKPFAAWHRSDLTLVERGQ